ncbi:glycosyltransferase family 4 protein [Anaeromyxobacter dehalogenans]|uniref:Glycosyl transferase, group 1 n=1 Tax=Anaeromyxobacter dehalogenans (strain 2CP-C) TaxID=290397 RepID=Q2IE18_ANADE|nr:glycosyltransferase family 1 protein [Anaeromyxobacter dehalogenans]ABC82826.1 glycosyl transferase, group 1 [Anaeromyxobacter dehalogenans 2CP-C]
MLRICIDARLRAGEQGGVQQALIGLASGLAALRDGDEEYLFLVNDDSADWLAPHVAGACRMRAWPRTPRSVAGSALLSPAVYDRLARAVVRWMPVRVPPSDGFVESLRADVVHFALQHGFRTSVPSIYVPHDLQHVHFPGFFSRQHVRWREVTYRTLARQAAAVVALTPYGKRDLVEHLGLDAARVHVIGWAPVLDAYPSPDETALRRLRDRLALPARFALFPAQTFPHKNHVRLFQALALLRARGVEVPLVCSGHRDACHPSLVAELRRLDLTRVVHFVGFVEPIDLVGLYRLASLLVFPSLFEGFGMPVLEAFRSGLPVACSGTSSLPDVAGGAAEMFDPTDVAAMAAAIERVWTDPARASALVDHGRRQVARFTWDRTARAYRALYRAAAGRPLDRVDARLLSGGS